MFSSNVKPMNHKEVETWEIIRAKGKLQYIKANVRKELKTFLYASVFASPLLLFRDGWQTLPVLLLVLGLLYVFAPIMDAFIQWQLNEQAYKDNLQMPAQHNNSFNRSAS